MIDIQDVKLTLNAKKNTGKHFGSQHQQEPLNLQFDLSVNKGEKVAICGKSGVGKSTLLSLIAGFVYPDTGKVILDNQDYTYRKPPQRPVSILFQNNNLFNHLTVADNIALGLHTNLKLSADDQEKMQEVSKQVGLADMLARKPDSLSGGQQQRVALARCLLRDKPILLLDEPFSALDKELRIEMLQLFTELSAKNGTTLLIVTHQPEELDKIVDWTIQI